MAKVTPLIKGAITGSLMVVVSLLLVYINTTINSPLQYLAFIIYAAGIAWTLLDYSRSEKYSPKFGSIFGEGFRCFIIIVIIMVAFRAIDIAMHPEYAEKAAIFYKQDLIKEGGRLPAEIDKIVETAKKQFATGEILLTIIGTLLSGCAFTAIGAILLIMRKK